MNYNRAMSDSVKNDYREPYSPFYGSDPMPEYGLHIGSSLVRGRKTRTKPREIKLLKGDMVVKFKGTRSHSIIGKGMHGRHTVKTPWTMLGVTVVMSEYIDRYFDVVPDRDMVMVVPYKTPHYKANRY